MKITNENNETKWESTTTYLLLLVAWLSLRFANAYAIGITFLMAGAGQFFTSHHCVRLGASLLNSGIRQMCAIFISMFSLSERGFGECLANVGACVILGERNLRALVVNCIASHVTFMCVYVCVVIWIYMNKCELMRGIWGVWQAVMIKWWTMFAVRGFKVGETINGLIFVFLSWDQKEHLWKSVHGL